MLDFVGATREEALRAKDRYGRVSQAGSGDLPPYWYGQITDVHSSGDYLKFSRRQGSERWYHRRDVSLHPERADNAAQPHMEEAQR